MTDFATPALSVKELAPGEFHWILLDETASLDDDLLSYRLRTVSEPYANASAAWVAGYLIVRAVLRGTSS